MNKHTPPAPSGWNKTLQDLFDESKKSGSAVGPPEVEWAKDYKRSLIPAGTRFPKKGDVYEATKDTEVSYLTSTTSSSLDRLPLMRKRLTTPTWKNSWFQRVIARTRNMRILFGVENPGFESRL